MTLFNQVHDTWLNILVTGLNIRNPQIREDDRMAPFVLVLNFTVVPNLF